MLKPKNLQIIISKAIFKKELALIQQRGYARDNYGGFLIRELKFKAIPPLMRDAILTSANVMVIIALSKLYIWILALERVPQAVALFISGLDLPAFVILLLVDLVILITGTFVDVSRQFFC